CMQSLEFPPFTV
nr:immunoglobulin light chain junction region [Macaca mulatta]